jgi:hypothetical protein
MTTRTHLAMFAVSLACACQGSSPTIGTLGQAVEAASTGSPCIPGDESWQSTGYNASEVVIEDRFEGCLSGVCLVNHFQGRVSCPYGQTSEQARTAPACFLPNSTEPVTVPVLPQLTGRRADVTVTCSCRCAGAGSGPFCDCPAGMECVEILRPSGLDRLNAYEGSYCIVAGTAYDPLIVTPACDPTLQNCGDPRPN